MIQYQSSASQRGIGVINVPYEDLSRAVSRLANEGKVVDRVTGPWPPDGHYEIHYKEVLHEHEFRSATTSQGLGEAT